MSVVKVSLDQIKLDKSLFKDLVSSLREETKKDPVLKKEYTKVRTKISSVIKRERLLEENPEIALELQRKQEAKTARKNSRQTILDKEEARKAEIRTARHARIAAEAQAKAEKAEIKESLFNDAHISEETRSRIVKIGTYDRRDSTNTLVAIKVVVSYKNAELKYDTKMEVVEFIESEEKTISTARDILVAFLVEIENE